MALTKEKIRNGTLALTKRGRYAVLYWDDDSLYAVTDAVTDYWIASISTNFKEGDLEKGLRYSNIIKLFGAWKKGSWQIYTWSRLEREGCNREVIWEDPEYIDYKKPAHYKAIDQYEPWEVCTLVQDMGHYVE